MDRTSRFGNTALRTVVRFNFPGQDQGRTGYVSRVEGRTYLDPRTGKITVRKVYEVTLMGTEAPKYTLRFGERMECEVLGKLNRSVERG